MAGDVGLVVVVGRFGFVDIVSVLVVGIVVVVGVVVVDDDDDNDVVVFGAVVCVETGVDDDKTVEGAVEGAAVESDVMVRTVDDVNDVTDVD